MREACLKTPNKWHCLMRYNPFVEGTKWLKGVPIRAKSDIRRRRSLSAGPALGSESTSQGKCDPKDMGFDPRENFQS